MDNVFEMLSSVVTACRYVIQSASLLTVNFVSWIVQFHFSWHARNQEMFVDCHRASYIKDVVRSENLPALYLGSKEDKRYWLKCSEETFVLICSLFVFPSKSQLFFTITIMQTGWIVFLYYTLFVTLSPLITIMCF